jgi:hypothetical protein
MIGDVINHPEHYTHGGIEPIDLIESQGLNFNRGNVVKYVTRAGRKKSKGKTILSKELEDLKKAAFYLQREISKCEKLLNKENSNETN